MKYQVSIEESIKRILETPLGSRVMLPEFGSKLHTLVDRKFDEKFQLDFYRYSAEAISRWENRVTLQNVELEFKDSKISYRLIFKEGLSYEGVFNV